MPARDTSLEPRRPPAPAAMASASSSLAAISAFALVLAPWALFSFMVAAAVYFVALDASTPMTLVIAGVVGWGWALYSRWVFRRLTGVGRAQVLRRRLRALGSAEVERLDLSHLPRQMRRALLETRGLRAQLEDLDPGADPTRMLWEWLGGVEALPESERRRFEGANVGLDAMRELINECLREREAVEPRRRLVDRLARLEELMLRPDSGYR